MSAARQHDDQLRARFADLRRCGLSFTECAKRLRISPGAVSGLVFRMRHPKRVRKGSQNVDRIAEIDDALKRLRNRRKEGSP